MDANPPALELHRVAKLYGRTAALKALSLRLEPAQTLALLGANGSGKTTLLKVIAGATAPTLGRVSIFGRDPAADRFTLRREVGLLAGETYLYDDLTACENLRFILTMSGRKPAQPDIVRALGEVDLTRHAAERVGSFSSGMKRRVALARLLLLRPRLLLLDEPYNSLDAGGAGLIDGLIRRTVREGGAVVLATHDVERSLSVADLVAVLQQGAARYIGPVQGFRRRDAQHVG